MRLKSKQAVPDHYRRAVRLGVAVFCLSALGFTWIGVPGREPAVLLLKWACLTLPVVTMPLLGKTTQVGAERLLGTIIGGLLGLLADGVATNWWTLQDTETDDIFIAAVAAVAAALSVLVGQRFGLDLSARLFVIAFLLVSFSAQQGRDPRTVAITRIGGLATGVAVMLLMSILILPKSASIEALRTLRKALEQLQNVNTVAWGPYLQQPGGKEAGAQQQAQQAEAAAAEPTARSAGGASRARRRLSGVALEQASLLEPLLPGASPAAGQGSTPAAGGSGSGGSGAAPDLEAGQAAAAVRRSSSGPWLVEAEQGAGVAQEEEEEAEQEAHLLQSEKALTELYQLLDKLGEQLGLAKNELFVANIGGHPLLLPGVWWPGRQARHLPWEELDRMAIGIRRVARLLNSALFTFQGGFDRQLHEALGPLFPAGLLPSLASGAGAAIQDLLDAFPYAGKAGSQGLAAYSACVLDMVRLSDEHRRQVIRAMRRFRNRTAARASWSRLLDAVLQQPAAAQQAAPGQPPEGQHEQPQAVGGGGSGAPKATEPVAGEEEPGPGGEAAAAGAAEQPEPREASLAGWLRRLGSGALGGRSGSAAGAPKEGEAGSEAGSEAGNQRTSPSPVTAASRVASANHRRGLSAALEELPSLAPSSDEAAGPVRPAELAAAARGTSPAPRPPRPPSAGALASPAGGLPRAPSLGRSSPSPGRASPLLSRVDVLREGSGSMGGMPLMLFPDTEEGHLAQVSWYSFHFLAEELAEQLAELHAAVNAVLARLPE